jgi:hypothetical protein
MSATDPSAWARDKRDKAARYVSELSPIIARSVAAMCPGVPVAAVIGACCNGGRNENTTAWRSCSDAERAEAVRVGKKPLGGDPLAGYGNVNGRDLHELGPLGAEAGRVPGLVAVDGTPWASFARSEGVKRALGREGVTGAAWHGAVDDQVAIGVASIVEHGRDVFKRLDARIRPDLGADGLPVAWTLWAWMVALSSWSAGNGGMASHLARYVDALAAVPEAQRWATFVRCASTYDGEGTKHRRPAYTALRSEQKRSAAVLAATIANDASSIAWLRVDVDDATIAALVRSASA